MRVQLNLLLDRARTDTLTAQIVSQIRDAIRFGRIVADARLPSSRRLSEQLGVGRNTVTRAYETLMMDGFVEARPASGMFAAAAPALARPVDREAGRRAGPDEASAPRSAMPPRLRSSLSVDFAPGQPNASLFPLKAWRRLMQTCLSRGGALGLTQPIDPFGLAALRSAISNHLATTRGIVADPGRIIVTSGAVQNLAIAARLVVTRDALVAMETPGSQAAASAFAAAGAILRGVPVDESGMVTSELPAEPTAVAYVTPSHQNPTGWTLAPHRRAELVAWARERGAMIVEDDVGCEFQYDGGLPQAIAATAPDRTLYLASFAQSLGPGVGLGYVVVPPAMIEAARTAKALGSGGGPWLEQAVIAEMLQSGGYIAHLTRMRIAYRERRDQLLVSLRRHFGEVNVSGAHAGLHVFWELPPGVPDAAMIAALARRARIGVYPLAAAGVRDEPAGPLLRRGLILGVASMSPRQIEQGVARLSDAIDDALDLHRIDLGDLLTHRPGQSQALSPRIARRPSKPAPSLGHKPALARGARLRESWRGQTLGSSADMPVVTGLYRYPVKGLSAQPVARAYLTPGQPFPFDRIFALARPGVAVTPDAPKWAKKGLFVMLMLDEGLASVRTHLDEDSLVLTVRDGDDRPVFSADLAEAAGRDRVENFFHRLAPTLRDTPRLVRARGGHFMDKPDNVISLINLATVRSLEERWNVTLNPLRFRANIYIDGARPWEEFDWIGEEIRVGDAAFHVDRRNGRCGATNVNPSTGERDRDIPRALREAFGHKDLGVYLVARNAADLGVGDALARPGAGATAAPVAGPAAHVNAAATHAFICGGCYYIYDEAAGIPVAGIPAGRRFADLPAAWPCPDCGTDKSRFRSNP